VAVANATRWSAKHCPGTVVLWRGGSTHSDGLKIGGTLLLIVAVIVAALVG
jgi:hypothetical protein